MAETQTVPMDLLGAVNQLLVAVGSTAVATVDGANVKADAQKALTILSDTCVQVQTTPRHFNTERDYPLPVDTDGRIPLPENTLQVTIGDHDKHRWGFGKRDYVARGKYLYDRKMHSFIFTEPAHVDIVLALEFHVIPAAARWYVTCLAGRRFVGPEIASTTAYRFSDVEVSAALTIMEQQDTDSRNASMAEVNPHVRRFRYR